jgi:hypothetical protein
VGRIRWIASLVGAFALFALCAPGTALAGLYSWNQPGEFTGANPEQKYGRPSWSYSSAHGGSVTGSSAGVKLAAGAVQSATVTWHDPFPPSQPVTVTNSSSITNPTTDPCVGGSLTLTGVSNGRATGDVSLTLTGGTTVSGRCTANVSIGISTATPTVTLSNPSNGSTFTNGLPQFSGTASTAFDASNVVTVRIFSGGSTSAPLLQTVNATADPGGSYSVVPSGMLANGLYTVQASQEDPSGQTNYSVPVSFYLSVSGPGLTLNSLGSKPLLSSSPTFTGRAGTRGIDSKSLQIQIYSGSSATGPVVQQDQGSVNADGSFSVRASAPLEDGRYTAVAGQAAGSTRGFSSPMTFRIKAHAPALTLTYPAKGGWDLSRRLTFLGQAGTVLGDTPSVVVELWKGKRAQARVVGKLHIPVSGPKWSGVWPKRLPNGPYTVRVIQTDDAGHTTLTSPRTFSAVTSPTTIGLLASVNRSGKASIPINCLAPPGSTCTGTVLVLTSASFRTTSGGPAGRIRILFAYVSIPTGQTKLAAGRVPGFVRAVLRGGKSVTVQVKTSLTWSGGTTHASAANRRLKIE